MNSKRILLVDDEKIFRDGAVHLFSLYGFEVDTAANCDQAVQRMTVDGYQAALVDLKMQGPDGVETASRLLKIKPNLPISILTGQIPHLDHYRKKAEDQKVPISEWFMKPIPAQREPRAKFFAKIEFDILSYRLRLSGREGIADKINNAAGVGSISKDEMITLMRAYSEPSTGLLPLQEIIGAMRLSITNAIDSFPDLDYRLAELVSAKELLKELRSIARREGIDSLKDMTTLVYYSLRNVRAEDATIEQLKSISNAISFFERDDIVAEDVVAVDKLLIEAGLDAIPDIKEDSEVGTGDASE